MYHVILLTSSYCTFLSVSALFFVIAITITIIFIITTIITVIININSLSLLIKSYY